MKRIILITFLFVFISNLPVFAQYYDPDYKHQERREALYERKVASYTKMKRVGTSLGLAGGVLTVSGIALVSSANWETHTYNGNTSTTTTDSEGITGLLMLVVGVPLAVTGIVLGTIGARKTKSYQERLNKLSFNLDCSPNKTGVAFTYRF